MGLIESVETLNEKTGVPKKEEIQPPDGPQTQAHLPVPGIWSGVHTCWLWFLDKWAWTHCSVHYHPPPPPSQHTRPLTHTYTHTFTFTHILTHTYTQDPLENSEHKPFRLQTRHRRKSKLWRDTFRRFLSKVETRGETMSIFWRFVP